MAFLGYLYNSCGIIEMNVSFRKLQAIKICICIVSILCCGFLSSCTMASLESSRRQVSRWGGDIPSGDDELPVHEVVPPTQEIVPVSVEPTKIDKITVSLPDPPVVSSSFDWLAKSDTSLRYGEWAEAIRTASAAIHRNPESSKAYINRSFAYNQKELFSLAIADANKAFLLDPLNVLALANRCYAKGHIGQLKEAREDCLAAIDLAPDFSMPYNSMGFILEEEGRLRESELYYEMSCGLKNNEGCQNQQRLTRLAPKR